MKFERESGQDGVADAWVRGVRLILSKKLVGVFDEADYDNDSGAGHPYEEEDLQKVHREQPNLEHKKIVFPMEKSFQITAGTLGMERLGGR
jgi:hypothetical protein